MSSDLLHRALSNSDPVLQRHGNLRNIMHLVATGSQIPMSIGVEVGAQEGPTSPLLPSLSLRREACRGT